MSEPIVQADFGGFNPRFPGVTIKFESEQAFAAFQDYFVADSIPQDKPDLATAVIRSVLDHEVRHYHDFLISPYSAVIFRMRLQAAFNGIKALQKIRDRPGAYLPVPLVRWVTLPEKERMECAHEWCLLLGKANPEALGLIDLPYFAPDYLQVQPLPGETKGDDLDDETFLRMSLENTCRAYIRIGDLTVGVAALPELAAALPELSNLAPYMLYEVTALATQAQSIWLGQGAAATQAFVSELAASKLPYARLWRGIQRLANIVELGVNASGSSVRIATFDQIAAISVCCLLGNYQSEGFSACPTVRFIKLCKHLFSAASATDIATDVDATWKHWDLATGVKPWRESLAAMLVANERGARQYEALATQKEVPPEVANAMHRYIADQRRIVDHLLTKPSDLVHVSRYCKLGAGILPFPFVRIQLDRIGVPMEAVQDTAFKPIWKVKIGDRDVATRLALRLPSDDFEATLEEAMTFEHLMHWCDLVFSDHEMPSDIQINTRRGIEEFLGKRLLFLV